MSLPWVALSPLHNSTITSAPRRRKHTRYPGHNQSASRKRHPRPASHRRGYRSPSGPAERDAGTGACILQPGQPAIELGALDAVMQRHIVNCSYQNVNGLLTAERGRSGAASPLAARIGGHDVRLPAHAARQPVPRSPKRRWKGDRVGRVDPARDQVALHTYLRVGTSRPECLRCKSKAEWVATTHWAMFGLLDVGAASRCKMQRRCTNGRVSKIRASSKSVTLA